MILATAHVIITLYSYGKGLRLVCKSASRDASVSYMREIASGETMRRLLILHVAAGRVLGNYAQQTPEAGRHFRHGQGGLAAWLGGMPSYHRAIPISCGVNTMILQSERTWGRLLAIVPRSTDHFTCTPGYSHNAVAEQHTRLYSLQ